MSATTDGRARKAKYPGTGMLDTPLDAWTALYRAYMAAADDVPLTDLARSQGIRYSAAITKAGQERWRSLRQVLREPTNPAWAVYMWQRYDAECAYACLERGSSYLAEALAAAPPPDLHAEPPPDLQRRGAAIDEFLGQMPPGPPVDVRAPVVDLAAYRNTLR